MKILLFSILMIWTVGLSAQETDYLKKKDWHEDYEKELLARCNP